MQWVKLNNWQVMLLTHQKISPVQRNSRHEQRPSDQWRNCAILCCYFTLLDPLYDINIFVWKGDFEMLHEPRNNNNSNNDRVPPCLGEKNLEMETFLVLFENTNSWLIPQRYRYLRKLDYTYGKLHGMSHDKALTDFEELFSSKKC